MYTYCTYVYMYIIKLLLFSGSRIFYDRSFLLQCRNSPLTRSPPPNMAKIPGVTTPGEVDIPKENGVVGDASQQKKGVVIVTLN